MKKQILLTAVTIFLNLTIGFADTIFTSKPNLKAWNPDFTYEVFGDYFNGSSLDQSKWNIDLCKGRGGLPGHSILTSNQGGTDNIQVSVTGHLS
jgi:hypothetical protein